MMETLEKKTHGQGQDFHASDRAKPLKPLTWLSALLVEVILLIEDVPGVKRPCDITSAGLPVRPFRRRPVPCNVLGVSVYNQSRTS